MSKPVGIVVVSKPGTDNTIFQLHLCVTGGENVVLLEDDHRPYVLTRGRLVCDAIGIHFLTGAEYRAHIESVVTNNV